MKLHSDFNVLSIRLAISNLSDLQTLKQHENTKDVNNYSNEAWSRQPSGLGRESESDAVRL